MMPGVVALNSVGVLAVASLRRAALWTLHHIALGTHIRRSTFTGVRIIWTATMDAWLHAKPHFRAGSVSGIKTFFRRETEMVDPARVAGAYFTFRAIVTTSISTSVTCLNRALWTLISCAKKLTFALTVNLYIQSVV